MHALNCHSCGKNTFRTLLVFLLPENGSWKYPSNDRLPPETRITKKNHPMIMITGRGGWLSWPRAENTDSFMNAVCHDLKLSCLDFILIDDSVMTITESESIFFLSSVSPTWRLLRPFREFEIAQCVNAKFKHWIHRSINANNNN
jgi:hypothetical protein